MSSNDDASQHTRVGQRGGGKSKTVMDLESSTATPPLIPPPPTPSADPAPAVSSPAAASASPPMLSAEHGRGTAAGGETLSETVVAIAAALDRLLAVASASSSKDCKDVCDSIAAAKALIAADSLPKFSDGVESADPVWPAFRAALAPALPAKLREAALDCLQKLIAIRCLRGASRIDSIASRAAHSASSASATAASPSGPANSTQSAAGSDYVGYLLSIVSFKPAVAAAPPHEDSQHANSEFDVSSPRLSSPGPQPPSSNSQASPSNHPASADNVPKPKQQNLFLIDEIVHFVCICFSSATPSTTALYLNSELYSAESSVHLQVLKVLLTAVTSSSTCQVHSTSLLKAVQTCFNIYLNSKSGGYSATAKASLTQIVHAVFSRMERYARLKAIESSEETAATRRDSDGIHNAGSSPAQPSTTRVVGMLEDDEPSVATTRDSMDEISGSSSSYFQSSKKVAGYENTVEYFNNLLRKDAFLVFRLLCRLSVQNESGSSASNSSAVLRSDGSAVVADDISSHTVKIRTLALEMMLSILTNAGPVVLTHEVFADLVKTMVVASVSRNAVATNLELFEFSLAIFLMLIRWYRGRIKMEIEVLLNTVYLHIVEMPNSTPSQKSMILESLYKICNDAQTIVDLYLNYDSDFHCASIYERILTICTRAAQQNLSHSTAPVSDGSIMGFVGAASGVSLATSLELRGRARMRLWGVRCLVAIVDSLVVWSRVGDYAAPSVSRFEPDPRTSTSSQKISVDAAHREDFGEHKVILNTRLRTVAIGSTAQNITPGAKGAAAVVLTPGAGGSGSGTPSIASDTGADEQQMQRDNIALVAHRKNLLREGLKLFVDKPIKAIDFFKKNGFIPKFAGEDEDDDVQTVAAFLKNTSGLSKAGIGSYLGEIDPFCVKVMHAFVDTLDFTGVGFVEALRMFLQTFRLPGEAQKIDRLMEKFADRYCENNPDVFAKADTAYTLAFSVIMLNTDLHSAHIKNRMDKPAFLKNNRGINDNSDLPDEYLEKIFDNIYENEIIMEDEQTNKFAQMVHGWGGTELSDKEKMDLWRKETAQIQKKSQQLISSANNAEKSPFRAAVQPDIAKPMFATACWPLIAVFSQTFESYSGNDALFEDDVDLSTGEHVNAVDLCLDGFAGGIKISAVFEMEMEREAFVTSLSKLTGLSHFRDFKPKNVKAIRTLLGLTLSYAEHLNSSWLHVVKVISQMERLQLLGSARGASLDSIAPDDLNKSNPNVEKFLSEFASQDTIVTVDRIFTTSTSMSGPAILQFFKAVCHACLEEVGIDPVSVIRVVQMYQSGSPTTGEAIFTASFQSPSLAKGAAMSVNSGSVVTTAKTDGPPRMFLLQKIVEIAHYNMHRIRFEWSQIWKILQPHFVVVACHPNVRVASFAVDALRQLSMKFLEREELVHFGTQNEFLKSFERIMKLTSDSSVRHMVLGSLGQMIAARAGSIRSGWKPIFVVLSRPVVMARSSDSDELISESFQLVQSTFKEYFSTVVHAGGLLEFVNCIAEFATMDPINTAQEEIVQSSIQMLQLSASQMIHSVEDEILQQKMKGVEEKDSTTDGSSVVPKLTIQTSTGQLKISSQPHVTNHGLISEEHFFLKWFPIFSAFSRIAMGSANAVVRARALESMFEVLSQCAHLFDLKCIRSIYRSAVLPIFDDLKGHFDQVESEENLTSPDRIVSLKQGSATIWILALRLTVDWFSECFETVSADPETLSSALEIALTMMQRRDQTLVATGQIFLHQFISRNITKFSAANVWPTIVDSIETAFRMTNPYELVTCDYSSTKVLPDPPSSMTLNIAALGSIQSNAPKVLAAVTAEGIETAKAFGSFVSLESLDFNQTILKCSVHIELLQSIRDTLTSFVDGKPAITLVPSHELRQRILQCFRDSYAVARSFNANYHLRYSIWKKRLVQQLPNLIKQETISLAAHIKLLFVVYRNEGDGLDATQIENDSTVLTDGRKRRNVDLLAEETVDVMERFVMMIAEPQVNSTNIGLWSPVVVLVAKELVSMKCWWKSERNQVEGAPECLELKKQLPRLFRLGIRTMGADRQDVRLALQEFIEKVGEELFYDMF